MILTQENYHSNEANKEYMNVSQFKTFRECEARAYAQYVTNEWVQEKSDSIHVGQIVHKYFDGSLDQYLESHPELVSSRGATKGKLKSVYQHAYNMIDTLKNDQICMDFLTGKHEQIFTAELFGIKWRCMLDVLNDGWFTDIKTTKSITEKKYNWVEDEYESYGQRLSFIEQYDYDLQINVYSEIHRIATNSSELLEPYIVAVSSEKWPDKAVICMKNEIAYRDKLQEVALYTPKIINIKKGLDKPRRCNKCDYCKSTKKLTQIIYPEDL